MDPLLTALGELAAVELSRTGLLLSCDGILAVCTAHFEPFLLTFWTSVSKCVTASTAVLAAVSWM